MATLHQPRAATGVAQLRHDLFQGHVDGARRQDQARDDYTVGAAAMDRLLVDEKSKSEVAVAQFFDVRHPGNVDIRNAHRLGQHFYSHHGRSPACALREALPHDATSIATKRDRFSALTARQGFQNVNARATRQGGIAA